MKNTDYFKNKRITVVGLARSGLACANLLFKLGAEVSVTDNHANEAIRQTLIQLKTKDIKFELGRHSHDFIRGRDLIITSPGVPYNAQPLIWAREFNIPVISEIEFSWMLCPGKVIAVTGSNGKTTVTTLIGKVLEVVGKKVFVCGNTGKPFAGEVEKIEDGDFVSLEVSSFQLETIDKFKPEVAVILNFSQNHLDRHKDMQEYLDVKKRIFMNQDGDNYLVLNYQDAVVKGLAKESSSKVVYFQEEQGLNPNQAAVLSVASIFGIPLDTCLDVFRQFRGVEHRLELVAEINNIDFINDSKSTTVEATLWALKMLKRPVVLIAGGRDKNLDYSPISDLLRQKAKAVVLIGEAKHKIRQALSKFSPILDAVSMDEAVSLAFNMAGPGDCILLSPMCASFDMFSDYEERGIVFKRIIADLAKAKS